MRRKSGAELSTNKEKSQDKQNGVSGKNANNRGLKGKASLDLDFVDFLNENIEERERSNREILANLLETEDMSPSEKGFLTKYKNKIAQIEANEAEISEMESELKELRKAGKKDSARAITPEGKIDARRKEIARDENMILNLEFTKPIKELLKREKDSAYIHARSDLERQITDASVLYLGENKKETKAWFQARGIDVPLGESKFGFIRSISQTDGFVN